MSENIGDREAEKSKQGQSRRTEDIIYDIVSQYNGVVEKLLEATQPDGRYSNRRLASSSNLQFLSGILHQIDDPLKELIYMLTSAQDPELTTLLNMLTNMVQVIDSSPPFQKIDVFSYKSGPPDFQGVNSKLIINPKGYAADLEKYAKKMQLIKDKYGKQIKATLFNIPDTPTGLRIREQYYQQAVRRYEQMQEVVRKIDEEILKAKELAALSPADKQDVVLDKETLKEIKDVVSKFATSELPAIGNLPSMEQIRANIAEAQVARASAPPPRPPPFVDTSGIQPRVTASEARAIAREAEKAGVPPGASSAATNEEMIAQARQEAAQEFAADTPTLTPEERQTVKRLVKDLTKSVKQASEAIVNAPSGAARLEMRSTYLPVLMGLFKSALPLLKKAMPADQLGDIWDLIEDDELQALLREATGPLIGSGRRRRGGVGKVADYLSNNPQQQHTRMGRPVSNDDDIQRQMIASNRNWQSKSNPVHATPIGSKNPFIEKSEESKYHFPRLLYKELSKTKPQKNALGADVSLLQGPIGGPTKYAKEPKKPSRVQHVTQPIAVDNILEGRGKGNRRNKGALHKLVFVDEKNEMFD